MTKHDTKSALTDRLLNAGLRVTDARLRVLEIMEQATRALSHADIDSMLGTQLDRVTLYRTLDRFVEAKLIRKAVNDDRITRFASMNEAPHHMHAHFHCDACGLVFCLPSKVPKAVKVPDGFQFASLDVSVHGYCASCAGEN
jgi:Fur family transcriptional regulator, ferric uptake regulator